MGESNQLKVIIAGGGVCGLTLANALEQAGVDYVLLERRNTISPNIGQSIASEPNGARILDQLGILEKWQKHSQVATWWYERDTDGEILHKTDSLKLTLARFGYGVEFGERQAYLSLIYDNIKDKSKVLINKDITSVDQSKSGVTVKCADGSVYEGDILAGADGVRSRIREEMWRLASELLPNLVAKDKEALFAEYKCLFGVAESQPGPTAGDADYGYDKDRSSLIFAGPRGTSYVFIFEKLDQLYRGREIPRFSRDDAIKFAEKHSNFVVRPGLVFADFWKTCTNFSLVSLEEGIYKLWTFGRIACLGDSIHKMTPNVGWGGNTSIESAGAFANTVKSISDQANGQKPSLELIDRELKQFQADRKRRTTMMTKSAGEVTRMQATYSFYHYFMAFMARIYPGEFIANILSDYFSDSTFLPPPKKSINVLQPFNPRVGFSQSESRKTRAMIAMPFIAVFAFMLKAFDITSVIPALGAMLHSGEVKWDSGSAPIRTVFYHIKAVDTALAPINIFFTPVIYGYDAVSRLQGRTFLTDFGVILAIWAFESVRRANAISFARVPAVFTMLGQIRGIGLISPLYYFLSYTSSPIEKFMARDMRLGQRSYALTVLPVLLLVYYLPGLLMLDSPTFAQREMALFFWQLFPIWFSRLTTFISYFIPDTTVTDRLDAPNRDLPIIKYTIGILAAISAFVWAFTVFSSSTFASFLGLFIPNSLPPQAPSFAIFTREFLRVDEISLFGCTFLWLGLLLWDLKAAGMVKTSWFNIAWYLIASVMTLGPGATAGLGWLWRENVLATASHKDAVTEETLAKWENKMNGTTENIDVKGSVDA